jgi:hypothetical protein
MPSKFLPINQLAVAPITSNEAVNYIQTNITPVISWATDWGISAGYAMLGVALFYQVVIILVKPDK